MGLAKGNVKAAVSYKKMAWAQGEYILPIFPKKDEHVYSLLPLKDKIWIWQN